jgi:hypothetical protein
VRLSEVFAQPGTFITEAARIQHAEDIVFWEGSAGALRALAALRSLADRGHQDVTIKWDGSPAIIFGRDENGEFILTDKSGFTAKGYDGKSRSGEELEQMFLNRSGGKNRDNPGYVAFAQRMKQIFPLYEAAVPADYRGFFKGDLLYFTTPELQGENYVFKPNVVEYAVDRNSDLGKRIGTSTSGVVIHREILPDGTEQPLKNPDIFQGTDVLVLPPVSVESPADVDMPALDSLAQLINQNARAIDSFLDPVTLKNNQITDLPQLFYAYTNSKVDTGMTNLGADFLKWLESKPKISDKKKQNVQAYISEHSQAYQVLWQTIAAIMKVKDQIIAQFDARSSQVKQSIGGESGGEGYVLAHPEGDIKLVPREFFSRANRAQER